VQLRNSNANRSNGLSEGTEGRHSLAVRHGLEIDPSAPFIEALPQLVAVIGAVGQKGLPPRQASLRLFYLPPYSPDRNPDELVWKHLKADTVGRMAITNKDDFKAKVRSSMRQLQNNPEKNSSFYQKPSLKYAA
jgi:hypothetical protein